MQLITKWTLNGFSLASACLILVAAVSVTPASAQSLADDVQIHGFGGWAYAETDGNYKSRLY